MLTVTTSDRRSSRRRIHWMHLAITQWVEDLHLVITANPVPIAFDRLTSLVWINLRIIRDPSNQGPETTEPATVVEVAGPNSCEKSRGSLRIANATTHCKAQDTSDKNGIKSSSGKIGEGGKKRE